MVPELRVLSPAENVKGRVDMAVLKVILPFVSMPTDTPLEVLLNTMVPVLVELVPADTHNGICEEAGTTLNVTSPFVSIPTETFCEAEANCTVPEDLLFVPADNHIGT
jgi:hypothetical protein